jgi:CobQ-like glutamine amidotransferase family enzyme
MAVFTIAHLYPDLLNLYGDRGNLLCLQQRMRWYGHDCRIKNIHLGDSLDYPGLDMLFMGGGSDREQGLVYQDLVKRSDSLLNLNFPINREKVKRLNFPLDAPFMSWCKN